MLDTESRNKLQKSILDLASKRLRRRSGKSVVFLGKIAGLFLDSLVVNMKAELDELRRIDEEPVNMPRPPDPERHEIPPTRKLSKRYLKRKKRRKLVTENIAVAKAIPRWLLINTNIISSSLNRMNFPRISRQIERNCIRMNIKKRDESFAALRSLSFVSGDEHVMLARDLETSGIVTTPEEAVQSIMKKKKPVRKRAPIKKTRGRSRFFF